MVDASLFAKSEDVVVYLHLLLGLIETKGDDGTKAVTS